MKIKICWLSFLTLILVSMSLLGIAGSLKQENSREQTLTIGASPSPHTQILEHIRPMLKKEGINLKVKVFQDYVLPNRALSTNNLDANYFQHGPFLKEWNQQNHGNLVSVGAIHLEPIGIYAKKIKHLNQLPNRAQILVSSNVSDYGRVIQLLVDAKLITLKPGVDITQAKFKDIQSNPKHLVFKTGYEPKLMPQLYRQGQADAVVINSNYAVQSHLNPQKDAIASEKSSSPYSNIVVTRSSNQHQPKIKKLVKALKAKSTQKWIKEHYHGSIEPVIEE